MADKQKALETALEKIDGEVTPEQRAGLWARIRAFTKELLNKINEKNERG